MRLIFFLSILPLISSGFRFEAEFDLPSNLGILDLLNKKDFFGS